MLLEFVAANGYYPKFMELESPGENGSFGGSLNIIARQQPRTKRGHRLISASCLIMGTVSSKMWNRHVPLFILRGDKRTIFSQGDHDVFDSPLPEDACRLASVAGIPYFDASQNERFMLIWLEQINLLLKQQAVID